jgi:exopolyphosphatase/guanosine-5'-triphosphate,3'-diphosphate pyrophosphatase
LYVDVGGGSTEFSLFSDGKIVISKSFKAGTVRLLNEMVRDVLWQEMEKWIKANTKDYDEVTLIGSGEISINYSKCLENCRINPCHLFI